LVFRAWDLFDRIRQKRHCPRPFDGSGDHSLMLGAVACSPGRNNLGVHIHEAPQKLRVFVVHGIDIVGAKIAGFRRDGSSLLVVGKFSHIA